MAGLTVAEYAPNAVKKAVIGVGHGEKKQIHMMVKVLMPRATFDTDDAADALAIAICHAHHRQSAVAMARMASAWWMRSRTSVSIVGADVLDLFLQLDNVIAQSDWSWRCVCPNKGQVTIPKHLREIVGHQAQWRGGRSRSKAGRLVIEAVDRSETSANRQSAGALPGVAWQARRDGRPDDRCG